MAYQGGKRPVERASKIAHMQLIQDQSLIELLQSYHSDQEPKTAFKVEKTGQIDLSPLSKIERIVTVDGGFAVIPNPIRRNKTLAFIQVGTNLLSVADLLAMRANPMMDPRDVTAMLQRIHYRPCTLPLSGVRIPGQTIRDTIRRSINGILSKPYTDLYEILHFLVHRSWLPEGAPRPQPEMECYACDEKFGIPKDFTFSCPHCGHEHFFSDYLHIGKNSPDEWSREESAISLMSVIETLALFEVPVHLARRGQLGLMANTLFIKDGPLLLRSYLSRLVEPIRNFIQWIKEREIEFYLVGIEKTGEFSTFLEEYTSITKYVGDYFIPSVKFLIEDVAGAVMDKNYRNRVSYGSKVSVRLSPEHAVPLNIPTGADYPLVPKAEELLGFEEIIRALSHLTSAQHDNALIPLVLANRAVSISQRPSGNILHDFMSERIK